MDNALEIITKNFEDIITSDKGHCTRVIATKNNKTWYSDLLSNRWLIALPIVIIILIFYIENRKVLAETASQTYNIDLRLYQVLEILPTNFIQISQSEIINIDSISHLKLTPNGLVEIFLKNESFTYSSRRYLKTIKEKLEL